MSTLPFRPSSDREKPPPRAGGQVFLPSLHTQLSIESQAQPGMGVGVQGTPPKIPLARPRKSHPGCPSHSPIWILLGKLAPTTAPRKPVQKKAKMCCIFLFALAKKKPRSSHRFGMSPLPFIPLSVLPVLFLLQFLPCLLPSARFVCFPWSRST